MAWQQSTEPGRARPESPAGGRAAFCRPEVAASDCAADVAGGRSAAGSRQSPSAQEGVLQDPTGWAVEVTRRFLGEGWVNERGWRLQRPLTPRRSWLRGRAMQNATRRLNRTGSI